MYARQEKTTVTFAQLIQMFPDSNSNRKINWENPLEWSCLYVIFAALTMWWSAKVLVKVISVATVVVKNLRVRTDTIMERSHIPINKWIYTIYKFVAQRYGISSLQVSKYFGVSEHVKWYLLSRIREATN